MRYALIGSLVLFAIMVFSIVDIVVIDRSRVKHLPKAVWILLVVLLFVVGSALWFTLGRARLNEGRGGGTSSSAPGPALGPDDDPEFLSRIAHDLEREQRIRELEEKLAELDDDDTKQ